jgi:hypothetical protein
MVTSASTPGSMVIDVICFTVSGGAVKSINRLWIRISKRSHVLVPSPHGDLRVVMRSVFVGMRTGPLCLRFFSRAPRIRSLHTAPENCMTFVPCSKLCMRVQSTALDCREYDCNSRWQLSSCGALFSNGATDLEVSVIRIFEFSASSRPGFPSAFIAICMNTHVGND